MERGNCLGQGGKCSQDKEIAALKAKIAQHDSENSVLKAYLCAKDPARHFVNKRRIFREIDEEASIG